MNKYTSIKFLVCAILFIATLTSCSKHENKYHNLIDKIEAESKDYQGISMSSEKYLNEIETIKITEGDHSFLIPERKNQIKSYACTECHSESLDQLKGKSSGKKAHWNIDLIHANKNTMNCVTCHNESDMDNLKSITGTKIDFNNSYNLCSQCHSKQFSDWKGGAHGKRIKSWVEPRLSLTCVNCHNPHKPSFDSRWPARFNSHTEEERK